MTNTITYLFVTLTLWMLAPYGTAAEITVRSGEITKGKDGGDVVSETKVMSLTESLHYGWMAHTNDPRAKVTYTETLKLPATGYNYLGLAATPAKTEIVMTKELDVVNGFFGHKWKPSRDDPGGEYTIVVTVDGKVILDTKFSLMPP